MESIFFLTLSNFASIKGQQVYVLLRNLKDRIMSKKCEISGTGVMSGNKVSHANNRTRRRFLPNLQVVSLFSEKLGKIFKMKVCSKTLRSIEHNGGLDAYLTSTSNTKLSEEAQKIKKEIANA